MNAWVERGREAGLSFEPASSPELPLAKPVQLKSKRYDCETVPTVHSLSSPIRVSSSLLLTACNDGFRLLGNAAELLAGAVSQFVLSGELFCSFLDLADGCRNFVHIFFVSQQRRLWNPDRFPCRFSCGREFFRQKCVLFFCLLAS